MDLSDEASAIRAVEGAVEVYNLAADMGGMGFIERFRVMCLRSILINTQHDRGRLPGRREALLLLLLGLRLQHGPPEDPGRPGAQGVGRLPGDGRAGLRLGEADLGDVLPGILGGTWPRDAHRPLPQHLRADRDLVRRPREGARGDVPQGRSRPRTAATCASRSGATGRRRAASASSTTACVGIDRIMHSDALIATPINLGSSELVSINELVSIVEEIAGVTLARSYDLDAPKGVAGRNSDNTFIRERPGLGTPDAPAGWHGGDVRLDRRPVRGAEGRPAPWWRADPHAGFARPRGHHRAAAVSPRPGGRMDRSALRVRRQSRASGFDGGRVPGAVGPLHGPEWHGDGHARRARPRSGATSCRPAAAPSSSSASCTRPRTRGWPSRPGRRTCAASSSPA